LLEGVEEVRRNAQSGAARRNIRIVLLAQYSFNFAPGTPSMPIVELPQDMAGSMGVYTFTFAISAAFRRR